MLLVLAPRTVGKRDVKYAPFCHSYSAYLLVVDETTRMKKGLQIQHRSGELPLSKTHWAISVFPRLTAVSESCTRKRGYAGFIFLSTISLD